MRAIALILLLIALPTAGAELEARRGNDSVRLYDTPCISALVLERIDPNSHKAYRGASAVFQGQLFIACWRLVGNAAHLVYEDGDQGIIPAAELKPVMDI